MVIIPYCKFNACNIYHDILSFIPNVNTLCFLFLINIARFLADFINLSKNNICPSKRLTQVDQIPKCKIQNDRTPRR